MFSRLGPAHGNRNPSHQSEIVQLQLQGWPSTWIRNIAKARGHTSSSDLPGSHKTNRVLCHEDASQSLLMNLVVGITCPKAACSRA